MDEIKKCVEELKKQLEESGQPVTVTDLNHLLSLVSGGGITPLTGGGPGEER